MSDLIQDVSDRDHRRGPDDAQVVLVAYCDFACPVCIEGYWSVKKLLQSYGDKILYVYRNLPQLDIHPCALSSARFAEAAGKQGCFWTFHDFVYENPSLVEHPHRLLDEVSELGLDVEWIRRDVADKVYDARIHEDIASARDSGVTIAPTYFLNGSRLGGDERVDLDAEIQAVITGNSGLAPKS